MINVVNFSISTKCSANCIFCPKDKGANSSVSFMSYVVFRRIIRKIKTSRMIMDAGVNIIRLDELGDLILNSHFIPMLRLVRKEFPNARIELHNHCRLMSRKITKQLLNEKLIDCLILNIDGIGPAYELVKNTSYDVAFDNFKFFVEYRNKLGLNLPIFVRSVTLKNYWDIIKSNFGLTPAHTKIVAPADDYNDIHNVLKKVLDFKKDTHERTWVSLWAERENIGQRVKIAYPQYSCPLYFRLQQEMFIAPNGNWYLCCLDSKQELVIGNILKDNIDELIEGPVRAKYLHNLASRRFWAIGGPCATVHCCMIYHKNRWISLFYRYMARFSLLAQAIFYLKHSKRKVSYCSIAEKNQS